MKALKFLFIAAVLVASLASCEAPHVFVDTKLKPNATEYAVEGRKNTFKNQMTIGEFAFDDAKDEYIGQIQMKDSSAWDFNVKNLNSINWISPAGGCATNGTKRIEIKDVRKAEGTTPSLMPDTIFGYTYSLNNESIAVVETIAGKGGVWIKKGLDPETEFLVANLAAAMLLRPDLSNTARR